MELRRIGRDVYACLQEDRGLGFSNSGFVSRDGGLVVDTFWDLPHTRRMIEHYAGVAPEPARRLVNTHHNGDHCWGNQLFPDAEIIGHRLCAAAFRALGPEAISGLTRWLVSQEGEASPVAEAMREWDFTGIELTPPTTLVEERLELDLAGIPVHLLYVGPAHTAGDLIVHLPEAGVLFAGDIIFRLCTPIGWEGTFERWCAALDRIAALGPQTIVPGHGPLCGVEGAVEMKAYLEYVRAESRACFDAGMSAGEAARKIDPGPYAGWTEPERIVFNVDRAYREFRGEPYDAPIDVATLFATMLGIRKSR